MGEMGAGHMGEMGAGHMGEVRAARKKMRNESPVICMGEMGAGDQCAKDGAEFASPLEGITSILRMASAVRKSAAAVT